MALRGIEQNIGVERGECRELETHQSGLRAYAPHLVVILRVFSDVCLGWAAEIRFGVENLK